MSDTLALDCCERAASRAVRLATMVTCSCGAEIVPPSQREEHKPTLRDLEQLARWLPVIEGRAMNPEPQVRGSARDGRSDAVDDHHHALQRAIAAQRRLRAMPQAVYSVLLFAYVTCGPELRARLSDWYFEIGLASVSVEQRAKWAKLPKALAKQVPRLRGEKLLIAACAAWERL